MELVFPIIETCNRLQRMASWDDPYKSVIFVLFSSYMIFSLWVSFDFKAMKPNGDWATYMLPSIFVFLALVMLWRRYAWKRRQLDPFKIVTPPGKNAVEQLLTLQEAITQIESLIQTGNIILLKIRALLFAVVPQATEKLALFLVLMATALALVPMKYLILVGFLECFTRNMPLRKESSERAVRRVREWWIRIPAAPVQLIKPDDKKRK
ncbi:hypothetical protein OROGR_001580 [Orobanche gracilis]